ncbi:MAG: hypothetical protein JWR09_5784, partial [Mucilaginibacter sp.]|nr:hypothetical protein [Mucilaginibacter sp.]
MAGYYPIINHARHPLNYAGTFEFSHFDGDAPSGAAVGVEAKNDALSHADGHTVIVPDAHLLFSGDYKRAGVDLVLSKDGHDYVVSDYFKGHSRATLSSPDGANLSGDLVNALTGELQLAQLGGGATAAATVIGRVTKLTGSATAIRNGVSIQLNMGDNVQKGDVVQAGADSSLGLTFIDGTVFGLSANARMVLNEMVYDPNGSSNSSLLSLVQGTITFVAGETAKHGDMKVDTPVATMGIRGTAVLVEIGFEVPGQGGAPPVKFQVLVERGGRVGSYVLYSKTGSILGTVNQAGQVTSVMGNGDTTTGQAPPLTQLAQDIITYTFEQFLLNNPNPRSNDPGGSTPANPVPGSSNPDFPQFHQQQDLLPGQPIAPIKFDVPSETPGTPPITVTITVNTPPTIVVTPIVVTLPVDKTNFNLADQVRITDPDSSNPAFNDVAVPYVPGSGRIISASGPSNTPSSIDLVKLISLDPQNGHVTYDAAAFKFLGEGQKAVYTIGFDSQSGPDTVHETLTFTVDGANDAPTVAAALTNPLTQSDAAQDLNLLAGAIDPDAGETATLSVHNVRYSIDGGTATPNPPGGVTLNGTTLHVEPGNFAYLGEGQTKTIVVSYDVTDAQGATVNQTETIVVTGVNDAPVVTGTSIQVAPGGIVVLNQNSISVTDPDGTTDFTFTVTDVNGGSFEVWDGENWVPATASGSQFFSVLAVTESDGTTYTFTSQQIADHKVRFVSDGSTTAPTFSVTADDGGSSNHVSAAFQGEVQPGANTAPETSPVALNSINEDSCAIVITEAQLLKNAADVDGQTLHVTGLQISSGGGTLCDNGNGTWTYTPASNYSGPVSFAYDVSDGVTSVSGSAALDIKPVADAPALSGLHVNTVADNFNGATLDTTKWHVYLPTVNVADYHDAFVTQTAGGVIELHDRGYLQSVEGFTPTAATPLQISGNFTINDFYGHFLVTDRTDGTTDDTFGGPANGITFAADGPHDILQIISNGVVAAQTSAPIVEGHQYSFSITDNGTHQTFTVTDSVTHQNYSVESNVGGVGAG